MAEKESIIKKGFSGLLMFVFGFAGFSLLGAVILIILITLEIVPNI